MLGAGFAEKLAGDIGASVTGGDTENAGLATADVTENEDTSFDFAAEPTVVGEPVLDTSFNFGFDFGTSEEISTLAAENATDDDAAHGIDAAEFNPFAPVVLKKSAKMTPERAAEIRMGQEPDASLRFFRTAGVSQAWRCGDAAGVNQVFE